MARETRDQKSARTQRDNAAAARLRAGAAVDTDFGRTVLGANLGPSESSEGWDIYLVEHSGFQHRWSSVSVLATFGREA